MPAGDIRQLGGEELVSSSQNIQVETGKILSFSVVEFGHRAHLAVRVDMYLHRPARPGGHERRPVLGGGDDPTPVRSLCLAPFGLQSGTEKVASGGFPVV